MRVTVEFNDVYDGEEHVRTEELDLPAPGREEDLEDWAFDHIYPRTGDGNAADKDAGYFTEITACSERPELVGKEFEWGV